MNQLISKLAAYALIYRLWNDSPSEPGNYIWPHMRKLRKAALEYLGITKYPNTVLTQIESFALSDEFLPDSIEREMKLILERIIP